MILADKITEERKKNGWSQEELANQLGVSRQAVSKWESAGAVPDLQRILQMSELFGVSTDYLLKDEMQAENITYHESTESYAEPLKKVTMENANEFLDMKRNGSKVVANATSMCILSPILLIVLVTMAEDSVFHVSESLATVFGCVFLLGMVAAAVFLFRNNHDIFLFQLIGETCTFENLSERIFQRSRLYIEGDGRFVFQLGIVVAYGHTGLFFNFFQCFNHRYTILFNSDFSAILCKGNCCGEHQTEKKHKTSSLCLLVYYKFINL